MRRCGLPLPRFRAHFIWIRARPPASAGVGTAAVVIVAVALTGGCGAAPPPAPATIAAAPGSAAPPPRSARNPFVDARWWSDPYAPARLQSLRLRKTNPVDAALLEKIADHGGADWIGEWTPNVENWIAKRIALVVKPDKADRSGKGALPLFVAYNIPKRDCGQYSAGGASRGDAYRAWIAAFARGVGDREAVIILEPDALPLLTKCLSPEDQKERLALIAYAVRTFRALPRTAVYIDAGHSAWVPAAEMAERLRSAAITEADGFSLNVSNYQATEALLAYGRDLSGRVGGKHFVIDTSRNGNGPPDAPGDSEAAWCNPDGRALGAPPTTKTGDPLCDAYLWIKRPGESDGECNGGPKAGAWWQEQALGLARRASW